MTASLNGKVAIVTGAASGIGFGVAKLFVEEGAKVIIADINDEAGLQAVAELGENTRYKHTDVMSEEAVKELVDFAVSEFGQLDIMHNNAGAFGARGSLLEVDSDGFDFTFSLLVKSVFLGMKYAAIAMKETGGGAIINTASISATTPGFGPHFYQGAKAAVRQLSKTVALEFAQYQIRVNCISPGGVYTPLVGNAFGLDKETTEKMGEGMGAMLPLGRVAVPLDMAKAVLFLASEQSAYITGQDIIIDGAEGLGKKYDEQGIH